MSVEEGIEAWGDKGIVLERQKSSHRLHREWCHKFQDICSTLLARNDVQQLCYVPTRENPAHSAFRGLNAAMQPVYILGIASLKDLHSYCRMRTIGFVLRLLKWRYLQMTLNWEKKPNLMLHLYMKTSLKV